MTLHVIMSREVKNTKYNTSQINTRSPVLAAGLKTLPNTTLNILFKSHYFMWSFRCLSQGAYLILSKCYMKLLSLVSISIKQSYEDLGLYVHLAGLAIVLLALLKGKPSQAYTFTDPLS